MEKLCVLASVYEICSHIRQLHITILRLSVHEKLFAMAKNPFKIRTFYLFQLETESLFRPVLKVVNSKIRFNIEIHS